MRRALVRRILSQLQHQYHQRQLMLRSQRRQRRVRKYNHTSSHSTYRHLVSVSPSLAELRQSLQLSSAQLLQRKVAHRKALRRGADKPALGAGAALMGGSYGDSVPRHEHRRNEIECSSAVLVRDIEGDAALQQVLDECCYYAKKGARSDYIRLLLRKRGLKHALTELLQRMRKRTDAPYLFVKVILPFAIVNNKTESLKQIWKSIDPPLTRFPLFAPAIYKFLRGRGALKLLLQFQASAHPATSTAMTDAIDTNIAITNIPGRCSRATWPWRRVRVRICASNTKATATDKWRSC